MAVGLSPPWAVEQPDSLIIERLHANQCRLRGTGQQGGCRRSGLQKIPVKNVSFNEFSSKRIAHLTPATAATNRENLRGGSQRWA